MRWFFCLFLLGGFAFAFNACERQNPEVLKALPGAGHHGGGQHEDKHQDEGGHSDLHGEVRAVDEPVTSETGHEETEAGTSH